MKKKVAKLLFVLGTLFCLSACSSGKNLKIGSPFSIKTDDYNYEITITGAERTTLLNQMSSEESKTNDIVYLDCKIKLVSSKGTSYASTYDTWNYVRVLDESGSEISPYEYALPGDDKSIMLFEKDGETLECTIPYSVTKNTRYLTVDMYQDTEYSNQIKVDIQ